MPAIGRDELFEARDAIYQEINGTLGTPRAWCEANGLDLDALLAWAQDDMEQHVGYMDPPLALAVGVKVGLRLGRTFSEVEEAEAA